MPRFDRQEWEGLSKVQQSKQQKNAGVEALGEQETRIDNHRLYQYRLTVPDKKGGDKADNTNSYSIPELFQMTG